MLFCFLCLRVTQKALQMPVFFLLLLLICVSISYWQMFSAYASASVSKEACGQDRANFIGYTGKCYC